MFYLAQAQIPIILRFDFSFLINLMLLSLEMNGKSTPASASDLNNFITQKNFFLSQIMLRKLKSAVNEKRKEN